MTPLPLLLDGYFYDVWRSQLRHTYFSSRTLTVQSQNVVRSDCIGIPASLSVNEESSLYTLCFLGILCTHFWRQRRTLTRVRLTLHYKRNTFKSKFISELLEYSPERPRMHLLVQYIPLVEVVTNTGESPKITVLISFSTE